MLDVGQSIGRYRIDLKLGEGGMGSVFRARDEQLGRQVAIKVVSAGSPATEGGGQANARLLREARAAAALEHPNAVAIHDVGEHEGSPYIVMEYVEGATLRTLVTRDAPPWRRRLDWLLDVARALGAAHAKKLVHRDVKPDNVMVRHDGVVKVVDFGIAREASAIAPDAPTQTAHQGPGGIETLTAEGMQIGTIRYMAPEQIRGGPVDGRADQFAWGVCAYELLGGSNPWAPFGTSLGLAAGILTEQPRPLRELNPALPPGLCDVLDRTMRKSADERFATMERLVAAVEAELDTSPAAKRTAGEELRPTGAAAELQRYSAEDVKRVIDHALRQQGDDERFSRSDLMEAAREIGVSEPTLQRALRELEHDRAAPLAPAPSPPWLNAYRRKEGYRFLRNLASFVIVNFFLLVFMHGSWQRWLLFGWGLGLALHALKVLLPERSGDKQAEGAATAPAVQGAPAVAEPTPAARDEELDRAAALLRQTSARRRLRIEPEPVGKASGKGEVGPADAAAAVDATLPEPKAARRER